MSPKPLSHIAITFAKARIKEPTNIEDSTQMAAAQGAPFSVRVHPYSSPTRGSCAYEIGNTSSKNAVIFIGGLMDGPHTVGYVRTVSKQLEASKDLSYSIFEIRMRSSFDSFGVMSLEDDVQDISALVGYLRSLGKENIILFGHSTGCQDIMEYTQYAKYSSNPVDGFILQGPVSDREALDIFVPNYKENLEYADEMIAAGRGEDCLPRDKVPAIFGKVMTAKRMHSLFAKGGGDDYFSSDLDDETVNRFWSHFSKPVLILHSEEDEYSPPSLDIEALNERWQRASPHVSPLSGLIPEAGHAVLEEESRTWLAEKVEEFLRTLS